MTTKQKKCEKKPDCKKCKYVKGKFCLKDGEEWYATTFCAEFKPKK